MKKKILVKGPALSQTGYGEQCRFALRALRSREDILDIYLMNIPWGGTNWIFEDNKERIWLDALINKTIPLLQQQAQQPDAPIFDMSLQVTIPNELERIAPVNVLYTAGIETNKVSPLWIQKCHDLADKILVISEHAKSGFKVPLKAEDDKGNVVDYILEKPIEVVHYPVRKVKTVPLELGLETDFNFFTMAQWGPRKNLPNTIKWFVEEFYNDKNVGLIVKVFGKGNSQTDKHWVEKTLRQLLENYPERKCKIYLLHGYLNTQELHSFYVHPKIKAMLNFGHGEGWGLPLFEAAYSGLPIITHEFGGQKDFLYAEKKDKTGKKKLRPHFSKINWDLKKVSAEAVWPGVLEADQEWAHPAPHSCRLAMREMVSNYPMMKGEAKRLKKWVEKNFKEEDKNAAFVEALIGKQELQKLEKDQLSLNALKEDILNIKNVKARATQLQESMALLNTQKEKLDLLKDSFKGEKCYVLACGPTLTDNPPEKVTKLLENNLTIAIKQAFNLFENFIDFHLYNCGNFKNYDYSTRRPVVLEASTTPFKLGECDLKFFIRERDFNSSVAVKKNFDEWTFSKQDSLRPYGPGIMYEALFYLLEHLGVSEAITLGWDNKLLDAGADKQHFYDKEGSDYEKADFIDANEVATNENSVKTLKQEESITSSVVEDWCDWLKENDCTLKIISEINPASPKIERVEL